MSQWEKLYDGYYWIRTEKKGKWQIAHLYKGHWWVLGTQFAFDGHVFKVSETRIPPPPLK